MGTSFEFDSTRDAIGANEIDSKERKAMLDKFKGAGGEVLSEKELRKREEERDAEQGGSGRGRRGGRGGGGDLDIKTPSELYREKKRAEADKRARSRSEWDAANAKISSGSARFFIKFRCFYQGLTPFGSDEVKPKFMNFLALEVKRALVQFNLIGNDLFLKDAGIRKAVIQSLDGKNPMLMEILEHAHGLFKHGDLEKLIENIQANPGSNTSLSSIETPLKEFYKKLYYAYPYQETLRKAIQYGVDVYGKESSDAGSVARLEGERKQVNKAIKNVFQVAFPRMLQLICRIDNKDYPPFSPILEKSLGLTAEGRLGKRQRGESTKFGAAAVEEEVEDEVSEEGEDGEETAGEDESAEGKGETAEDEKKEEKKEENTNPILSTKEYQYGLSLMSMYDLNVLRKKLDPNGAFDRIPVNDKVLLAYLFFQEYDTEYSFVQTTNKIRLNVDYIDGVKTDLKQILADLYNESRGIQRAFEKYHDAEVELDGLRKKKMSSNYIEQSKMETKQEKNLDLEARNTRGMIRGYMESITVHLAKLISDMKGAKEIVANMDEVINFDATVEGKKRLNGKMVQQCIMEAYCYSLALKERLDSGDLYGGIVQMSEEEMMASFGKTYAPPGAEPAEA